MQKEMVSKCNNSSSPPAQEGIEQAHKVPAATRGAHAAALSPPRLDLLLNPPSAACCQHPALHRWQAGARHHLLPCTDQLVDMSTQLHAVGCFLTFESCKVRYSPGSYIGVVGAPSPTASFCTLLGQNTRHVGRFLSSQPQPTVDMCSPA